MKKIIALSFMAVAFTASASAQATAAYGTVSGTVLDTSGAVVPGFNRPDSRVGNRYSVHPFGGFHAKSVLGMSAFSLIDDQSSLTTTLGLIRRMLFSFRGR